MQRPDTESSLLSVMVSCSAEHSTGTKLSVVPACCLNRQGRCKMEELFILHKANSAVVATDMLVFQLLKRVLLGENK